MRKTKSTQSLAKLLGYVLERRPDEFGLVLDKQGYVKIKELLKALNEEKGWKHVRQSHLNEILYSVPKPPFEILDNRIRATQRDHLPRPEAAPELPKLLYTGIRRKAYPFVAQNGIFPSKYHQVVLSADRDLAERMGKRTDPQPVILTVQVRASVEHGVLFQQAGRMLFLAASIPTGCFSGPPLPKEGPETKKPDNADKVSRPQMAGSYALNLDDLERSQPAGRKSQKRRKDWKESKKGIKKQKRKRERPPWRK